MDRLDRLARRFERIFTFLVPIVATLAALIVMGVLIWSLEVNPITAYHGLLVGAFGSKVDIANSLNRAAPLMLVGLGVAIAFRGGMFNIGGEGQIIMGAILATAVGVYIPGLPAFIHLPLCLMAGFIGGALWAAIPGYFYAKNGINLIITTIMMNEIANGILPAIIKGPMLEPPGFFPQTAMVMESAKLPLIWEGTRLHAGIIVSILSAIIMYVLLFRTPFGFEARSVGENEVAARHNGINVFSNQMLMMLISGGLGGLAGTVEILGAQYRLREAFLMNYGYEALAVALLAQRHPLGVIISGLLFGALKSGANSMQITTKLPMALVSVVGGTIVLFVVASNILMKLPGILAKREVKRGLE